MQKPPIFTMYSLRVILVFIIMNNHVRSQKHLCCKQRENLVTDDKHVNIADLSTWPKQMIPQITQMKKITTGISMMIPKNFSKHALQITN